MMTWGEFKKAVEDRGVKDDNQIGWIDVDACSMITGLIIIIDENGEVEIE